jgi:hypothetical protein
MAFFGFFGGSRVDSGTGKSAITERLSDIARRCGDLSPLREPVRRILIEGNKVRALAGVDAQGRPFAPLAASTLRGSRIHGGPVLRRQGPPLAPHYAGSREVTGYTLDIQAGVGRLSFAASWPGQPWMIYHHTGTPRMPRRDPYGFRQQDLDLIRPMMSQYILKKGWFGR